MRIIGSIVLYKNDLEILRKAIMSFLSSPIADKLYLIDNSPDNSLQILDDNERIEYIHNPSNPGFGAAHNIAIKKALDLNADYHLVLNPDIYFGSGVLEQLGEYMDENPLIGNIMPKVLYPNGTVQYLCKLLPTPYDWIGRRFNPIKKMVENRNKTFEMKFSGYNKIMDVPYLSGCFMFLRLDALKEVGLFDENIFMYGEETDLCRRLIEDGYRTVFYPDAVVFHHFEKGSHKSWRLTKIGIQSAIYYFNKWGWIFDRRRKEINRVAVNQFK